jgi:hypothetical protein
MPETKPAYKPDFKKYDQQFLTRAQIKEMGAKIATIKPSIKNLILVGVWAAIMGALYGLFIKVTKHEMLIDKQTNEQSHIIDDQNAVDQEY